MSETCILCGSAAETTYQAEPEMDQVSLCLTCAPALAGPVVDAPHWQCLQSAIWSDQPAIQVTAWRVLQALQQQPWARALLPNAALRCAGFHWS